MKNQRNRFNIPTATIQNEVYNQVGEGSFSLLFKLGKSDEEILSDLIGKLSIPTNSLNAMPSLFIQN